MPPYAVSSRSSRNPYDLSVGYLENRKGRILLRYLTVNIQRSTRRNMRFPLAKTFSLQANDIDDLLKPSIQLRPVASGNGSIRRPIPLNKYPIIASDGAKIGKPQIHPITRARRGKNSLIH